MAWLIEFTPEADKSFAKLDRQAQKKIRHYLRERIVPLENPACGITACRITASYAGLWSKN